MKKYLLLFLSCLIIIAFWACSNKGTTGPGGDGNNNNNNTPVTEEELKGGSVDPNTLFLDKFNYVNGNAEDKLNKKIWQPVFHNNESAWNRFFKNVQGYEMLEIKDGHLVIKAHYKDIQKTGGVYTVQTYGKGTRITVRAKLVWGAQNDQKMGPKGGFPALWWYPFNPDPGSWPKYGEIDLMEWTEEKDTSGTKSRNLWNTIHYIPKSNPQGSKSKTSAIQGVNRNVDVNNTYYTYTCDIIQDKVILYMNGQTTLQFTSTDPNDRHNPYPYNTQTYNFIMNSSFQNGGWGFNPEQGGKSDYEMWVDWIKVEKIDPNGADSSDGTDKSKPKRAIPENKSETEATL